MEVMGYSWGSWAFATTCFSSLFNNILQYPPQSAALGRCKRQLRKLFCSSMNEMQKQCRIESGKRAQQGDTSSCLSEVQGFSFSEVS